MTKIITPLTETQQIHIQAAYAAWVHTVPGLTAIQKVAEGLAVPRPSADHLDDDLVARLLTWLHAANHPHLLAITLESAPGVFPMAAISATTDGLWAFNEEYHFYTCLLTPPTFAWFMLCTKADYILVVGRESDVMHLLGSSVAEAQHRFAEYITEVQRLAWLAESLTEIAQCAETYQRAPVGGRVAFRW